MARSRPPERPEVNVRMVTAPAGWDAKKYGPYATWIPCKCGHPAADHPDGGPCQRKPCKKKGRCLKYEAADAQ